MMEQRGGAAVQAPRLSRVALSYYVTSGLSAAFGLFLISAAVHWVYGPFAGAAASIGAIVVVPPDQPAPQRGKFWQLLPAVLIGVPLFFGVQLLHADPLRLGLLIIPACFSAFLAAAWGKRGIPIAMSAMFAIIFSMALPVHASGVAMLSTTAYFALGAVAYSIYATAANSVLNARYRVQMLADTLLAVAALMRTQALQFDPLDEPSADASKPMGRLLREQAALADLLQTARNLLLEKPRTARRQQLAGMLLQLLETRDRLLACELDVELLTAQPKQAAVLKALRKILEGLAADVESIADALLRGRLPERIESVRRRLEQLPWNADESVMLGRALAARVGRMSDEIAVLNALARSEAEPDLDIVQAYWRLFISPTQWSWRPLVDIWRWDAPPLRHAIRAALAIATAYAICLIVPWRTHAYWILLTIVVVLRGSFAQTLERRNARVGGTLLGSLLATALLSLDAPRIVLVSTVNLAQGVAHAFAVKRYLITAVAATVFALVQAHLLITGSRPAFEAFERIADTLIGAAVAWAFSYVLPSWERTQIPSLVNRVLDAHARHTRLSLGLAQLQAIDAAPELEWRLARREAYDALSALGQAAQRSLAEPRAVRPALVPLERFLARSYQMLALLTAIKTMLLMRRGHLDVERIAAPLAQTALSIDTTLTGASAPEPNATTPESAPAEAPAEAPAGVRKPAAGPAPAAIAEEPPVLPDPFGNEVTPWLLLRLLTAARLAEQLRADAGQLAR